HLAVPVIIIDHEWAAVYADLFVIDPQTVTLGIRISKDTALQHLVRRKTDPVNNIRWAQGCLLDISEEISWVLIQLQFTNLDQRVFFLAPCLGQVKGIKVMPLCLLWCHELDVQGPFW